MRQADAATIGAVLGGLSPRLAARAADHDARASAEWREPDLFSSISRFCDRKPA